MAYEFEREEWACAVAAMTETERATTEYDVRRAAGMCGDREDARYEH